MREQRPSAADRTLRCLGSVALIDSLNLPPTTSDYAVEGTAAHTLGEMCLRDGKEPMDYISTFIPVEYGALDEDGEVVTKTQNVLVTTEMCEAVEKYVEVVTREAHGNVLLIEKKVNCSPVLGKQPETGEDRTGTADAIIVPKNSNKPLQIHDYKHGAGVEVDAHKNFQMMVYGGSFLLSNINKLPHRTIQLWIHQPRIKFEPDMYEISREELLEWCMKAKRRAIIADECEVGDKLLPGEKQCKWCEAGRAGKCPAIDKEVAAAFENIDTEANAIEPPENVKELATRLKKLPFLEMYIKATRAEAYQTMDSGHNVPGFKLVAGKRGARAWTNEAAAEERIKKMRVRKDDMFNMKLKTPTQLEKVISEKRYELLREEGLIDQPPGKPSMVPADDPREGITHENRFENIEDK